MTVVSPMTRSLSEYKNERSKRREEKLKEHIKAAAKQARRKDWQSRKVKRWSKPKRKLKNYGLENDFGE